MPQFLPLFLSHDWQAITSQLSHLSNSDFRRCEKVIRESILPSLPADTYWEAMLHLIKFKRAAFITGILALGKQLKNDEHTLLSDSAKAFATFLSHEMPDSVPKVINMALPQLGTEQQILTLFNNFDIDSVPQRVGHLLRVESPLTYFVMFKTLKFMPDNQDLARRCCILIMKRNNDMAFNMVSILRAYFELTDIKSRLSLHIDTFELSYLDRSYETFLHMLNGKRPKL